MAGPMLVLGWAVLLAASIWWLLARMWAGEADWAEPAPAADPYAGDVAAFRRQVHDWDRGGLGA